jgi:hypothetical protein
MSTLVLNLPTFAFVVATRAMLGAGAALLLADRLDAERRRTIGLSLLSIGAATTIPAAIALMQGRKEGERLLKHAVPVTPVM